jgi:hypothetical protein
MAATLPIKIYEILEAKLGKEDAKEVVNALEEVAKSLAKKSKLEMKDEIKNELVTKGELDLLGKEFHAEMKALRAEFRMYFVILVCLIILLNPRAIDLIAKFLGVIK